MFEVDLLNTTGLQKHISRIKIQDKGSKQTINFKNLFEEDDSKIEVSSSDANDSSIVSLLIGSLIALMFFFFGFVDLNKTFLGDFFLPVISDEMALVYVAEMLAEKDNELEGIIIDESLRVVMVLDNLDMIDAIKNSNINFSYKIYELDDDTYRVIISHLLKNTRTNRKENFVLSTVVQRYENDYILDAVMYDQSLLFTSDYQTIIKILEDLIYFGNIKIWPSVENNRFNLEYSL